MVLLTFPEKKAFCVTVAIDDPSLEAVPAAALTFVRPEIGSFH